MSEIKFKCETTHALYRNEKLVNLVEFLFRTPQSRLMAWKFVAWLRKNKYIEKALRGKLVWSEVVKEEL